MSGASLIRNATKFQRRDLTKFGRLNSNKFYLIANTMSCRSLFLMLWAFALFTPFCQAEKTFRSGSYALESSRATIIAAAFSGRGNMLATALSNRNVLLYDANSGKESTRLGSKEGVRQSASAIALSYDGSLLLIGSKDNAVRIFSLKKKELELTLETPGDVTAVAITDDGKTIIAGLSNGECIVWSVSDVPADQMSDTEKNAQRPGKRIGGTLQGKTVQETNRLRGHQKSIIQLAVRPGKPQIAVASEDKSVTLWEPAGERPFCVFRGHKSAVTAVAFDSSPKSTRIASGSDDGMIHVWEFVEPLSSIKPKTPAKTAPRKSAEKKESSDTSRFGNFFMGPDEKKDPSASGRREAESDKTGESRRTSPGNRSLFFAQANISGTASEQSALSSFLLRQTVFRQRGGSPNPPPQNAQSPGGTAGGAAKNAPKTIRPESVEIRIPIREGLPKVELKGHRGKIIFLAFGPGGTTLISASRDKTVIQWNIASKDEWTRYELFDGPLFLGVARRDAKRFLFAGPGNKEEMLDETALDLFMPASSKAPEESPFDALPGLVLERRLSGQSAPGNKVAFSPDGRRIVSVGSDENGLVWDAANGNILHTISSAAAFQCLAFHPNEPYFVTGLLDGSVISWNLQTGKELKRLRGHTSAVLGLAFSGNGERLLTASADRGVTLWSTNTGSIQGGYRGHEDAVLAVAVSPDLQRVATASGDMKIGIWKAGGALEKMLDGHSGPVTTLAFNRAGTLLATGSEDAKVILWDNATLEEKTRLKGFGGKITCLAFGPADQELLVGGEEGRVVFFETEHWQAQKVALQLPKAPEPPANRKNWRPPPLWPEPLVSFSLNADGSRLVTGGGHETFLWKTQETTLSPSETKADTEAIAGSKTEPDILASCPIGMFLGIQETRGTLTAAPVISPDGKLAAAVLDDTRVTLWTTSPSREIADWTSPEKVSALLFGNDRELVLGTATGSLFAWNVSVLKNPSSASSPALSEEVEIVEFPKEHDGAVVSLARNGNGTLLLSGGTDRKAVLWNRTKRSMSGRLEGIGEPVSSVALVSDGSQAVTATTDGRVRIWNPKNFVLEKMNHDHRPGLVSTTVSPNGLRYASTGSEGTVRLYSLPAGRLLRQIGPAELGFIPSTVSFSPDGTLIALAGTDDAGQSGRVVFWHAVSGKIVAKMPDQHGLLPGIAFTPDGRGLLFGWGNELRAYRLPEKRY